MWRDLQGKWLQTAALARRHCRPFGLAALGLSLSLALLGGSPSMAQAARQPEPTTALASAPQALTGPALGRASITTQSHELIVRSDTLTSSEPDYDSLDPLDESMTNPDIDAP
jgi:hypothetical protein